MYNFLLALCLLFVTNFVSAQTTLQIISDFDNIDSVVIRNFEQDFSISKPYKKTLQFDLKNSKVELFTFYFEDKTGGINRVQIWLDPNLNIKIWVGEKEGQYVITRSENTPTSDQAYQLMDEFARWRKEGKTDSIGYSIIKWIRNHPGNTFSVMLVQNYLQNDQNPSPQLAELEQLMLRPENNFDWFLMYPLLMTTIKNIANPQPIQLGAYDFIGMDSNAQKIAFKKGAITVLDFWFLGCVPCRKDHTIIKEDIGQMTQKDIQFISVNISDLESLTQVNAYLETHNYQWLNYFNSPEKNITNELGINAFPFYLVLDDQGNIQYRTHRYSAVKTFLKLN